MLAAHFERVSYAKYEIGRVTIHIWEGGQRVKYRSNRLRHFGKSDASTNTLIKSMLIKEGVIQKLDERDKYAVYQGDFAHKA